jgi:alpha,alpha-trehalose phosphorylase
VLRKRLNPPRDLFPIDPWRLEINRFDRRLASELVGPGETAFALSNGYLGLRGNHEEDRPIREAGTYLNGFYEHRPIVYGEHAYGFPKAGQTMLNCPDGKIIKLYVDDEPFDLETAELVSFNRRLEMREGTLRREIVFRTPTGKRIRLTSCRLVSFHHRHLAAIFYEVVAEDAEADLVISSETINRQPLPVQTTDPRVAAGFVGRVLKPAGRVAEGLRAILSFTTSSSGLTLGCGMEHVIESGCAFTADVRCEDDFAAAVFKVRGEAGKPVRIVKFLSYHYGERTTPREISARAAWTLDRALKEGFDTVLERQRAYVAAFWERADVEVEDGAPPEKQQVIRWNLFQLLQASARAEGHGIGARGLTGQTYEGHYFWDTEIYVLPFLIYTNPPIARSILKFRYDQLDKARARARELGHPGATFPWRTIDGHEASAYYAAGTAQYHINADIAYAIRKYVEVTGDEAFLREYGAEILVETARFWVDLGGYVDRQERRFCINGVTGPDEYTAVVNNNYFTNVMARENLRYACETLRSLQTRRPDAFERLRAKTGFEDQEPVGW